MKLTHEDMIEIVRSLNEEDIPDSAVYYTFNKTYEYHSVNSSFEDRIGFFYHKITKEWRRNCNPKNFIKIPLSVRDQTKEGDQ